MRIHAAAGENSGDLTRSSERHVQHEIVSGQGRNLKKFGVQGIVFERAFKRSRFAHEGRRVQNFNGFLRGQSGGDELPAAGKAGHLGAVR
jgi:hypothetical protein